jgi:hypothetical protein
MYDPQEHPGSKIPYILLLTGTHYFLIQNIHITTHRNTRVPRYHILLLTGTHYFVDTKYITTYRNTWALGYHILLLRGTHRLLDKYIL